MTAERGHGDERDDLPERVIVVREAAAPEATDAEIAALIDEVVAAEGVADVEVLDSEEGDDEPELVPAAPAHDAEIEALLDELVAAEGPAEVEVAHDQVLHEEVLHEEVLDDQVPDDQVPDDQVPDDQVPDDQVPDDQVPDDDVPDDDVPDDGGDEVPAPAPPLPLDLGWDEPERDETDPAVLRPKASEPVLVARTTSRSRAHRAASRLRAIIGLAIVVVLSGFVLAAAIGAAVVVISVVLSKAFGSG